MKAEKVNNPVCAVAGVEPGIGAAMARVFSEAGYKVALPARTLDFTSALAGELDGAIAAACDVTSEADVKAAFAEVRNQLGEVSALVYNAVAGSWGTIEEISASEFEGDWKVNALGAFLSAQQFIPAMKKSDSGSIVFVGATASRRGGARTAAFAPAKAAQGALAESMLICHRRGKECRRRTMDSSSNQRGLRQRHTTCALGIGPHGHLRWKRDHSQRHGN